MRVRCANCKEPLSIKRIGANTIYVQPCYCIFAPAPSFSEKYRYMPEEQFKKELDRVFDSIIKKIKINKEDSYDGQKIQNRHRT